MARVFSAATAVTATVFAIAGCGTDTAEPAKGQTPGPTPGHQPPAQATSDPQFCAHNIDPTCPSGSFTGPFVSVTASGGHWDADGRPVNGGPTGADGSTGNNLALEYCAKNQDPGCPAGSYVAPNAIPNPDGSHTFVVCEGTICTNPNHGGGTPPGHWAPDGQPFAGGPVGADGSTGNNLTHEYCAQNEDPGCPAGTFVDPNAIKSPDGSNSYVVCEGTICTNPNHGAGDGPAEGVGEDPAGDEPPADITIDDEGSDVDTGGSTDDGTN